MAFRSWLCLAKVLTGLLLVAAQDTLVSTAVFNGQSADKNITCVGHIPQVWKKWYDTFRLPYPYQGLLGHPNQGLYNRDGPASNLAEFCAKSIGSACMQHSDMPPQHVMFPLLLELEAEYGQGEVRPLLFFTPPPVDGTYLTQATYRYLQMAAEFCSNKCQCTQLERPLDRQAFQNPFAPQDPEMTPLTDNNVLEWNFDSHTATKRARSAGEQAWWKSGLVKTLYIAPPVTTMTESINRNLAQYYVGDPDNKPICNEDQFSNELSSLLSIYTDGEEYSNAKELCAHRYYGGNNFTSLGGICLLAADGTRHLSFPYELRSPYFTRDYPRGTSLQGTVFPLAVETFCHTYLSCDPAEPMDINSTSSGERIPTSLEDWAMIAAGSKCESGSFAPGTCASSPPKDKPSNFAYNLGQADFQQHPSVNDTDVPTNLTCPAQCDYGDGTSKPVCGGAGCICRAFEPIDPVAPPSGGINQYLSWCVSTAVAAVAVSANKANPNRRAGYGIMQPNLNGRNLASTQDPIMPCPCNMTYVSEACCDASSTGLIWEDGAKKLGEIRR